MPIRMPRAENKLDTPRRSLPRPVPKEQHGPCSLKPPRPNTLRAAKNTARVRPLAHTAPPCTARDTAPCSLKTCCTVRVDDDHAPCKTQNPRTRLFNTPRVTDLCCSCPSASWSSAHSQMQLFTQTSTATSSKPNHCQITPLLPSILLKSSPKP